MEQLKAEVLESEKGESRVLSLLMFWNPTHLQKDLEIVIPMYQINGSNIFVLGLLFLATPIYKNFWHDYFYCGFGRKESWTVMDVKIEYLSQNC